MKKDFFAILAVLLCPVSIFGAADAHQETFLTRARNIAQGLFTRNSGYSFAAGALLSLYAAEYAHPIKMYQAIPSTENSLDDILHMGSGLSYTLSRLPTDDASFKKESQKTGMRLGVLAGCNLSGNINNSRLIAPELTIKEILWDHMCAITGASIGSTCVSLASASIWENLIAPRLQTSKNEIAQKIAYNAKLIRYVELIMLPISITAASNMMFLQTEQPFISTQELIQRTMLSTGQSVSNVIITQDFGLDEQLFAHICRAKLSSTSSAFKRGLAFGYTASLLYALHKMQPSFFAELPEISQGLIKICGTACIARLLLLGYKQLQDMNINLILW